MEPVTIITIVSTVVLGILTAIFGGKVKKGKGVLKEAQEFIGVIREAIEDNNVTNEEVKAILAEYEDLEVSIKALTGGSDT